jgi:hypothetical protein
MLEIIKAQYESAQTLSKAKFYLYHTAEITQINGEMYPFGMEYFHELNPAFLFKVHKTELLNQYSAVTVRDGTASFGAFVLKNFQTIAKMKTHFFIHPGLAYVLPNNIKHKFSTWHIVQTKKIKISQTKRVVILGLMNDKVLPSLTKVKEQLKELSEVSPDCKVELFLPIKRNPFGLTWAESYIGYEIVEMIKTFLPNNKLTFLTHRELLESSSWQDTYCIDLLTNKLILTDSFLNHYIASRGGTISTFGANNIKESVFEIDLNFNHKIQFAPLPEVESIFADMMFYKKVAASRDYASDALFHDLLRQHDS